MSDEESRLVGLIFDVLNTPSVAKINFTLGAINVDCEGFVQVIYALLHGAVHVRSGVVPNGAKAAYNYDDNLFEFPSMFGGMEINDRSVIVHESVHAMRDIQGAKIGNTSIAESEDEAAGYVAGALFHLYETTDPSSSSNPIFVKAYEIARKIINIKGAAVSDTDARELRNLVAADPTYSASGVTFDSPTFANGVYR